MLSGTASNTRIGAALDAGALAWVPEMAPIAVLLRAVRAALAGRDAMPPARRDQYVAVFRRRRAEREEPAVKLGRLTPRARGAGPAGRRAPRAGRGPALPGVRRPGLRRG
ncbi:hypothetical protein [Pseudonocardia humida]|uniref:Response regulatory domain-containing protein n=1 Tax=Pseudonocardia humida TaxID=2800819 RepID=A0ABT1A5P0_9PSEU|nr:hypothetical protein [Pseudonocardia humida]MCO1658295.1 hypothetical protein [Pseudonocardia humida]